MDFYKVVCDICNKRNMSLSALLSDLGMSKANIRNWKNGVTPKISIRQKIAELTDTPIEKLLTADEKAAFNQLANESKQ